jgi:hypothetical protein
MARHSRQFEEVRRELAGEREELSHDVQSLKGEAGRLAGRLRAKLPLIAAVGAALGAVAALARRRR